MQNNITEIVEYIDDILSEFGLDFDMSEDQEGTYLYNIIGDFNIDATIEVVSSEEITIYYNIRYNGKSIYTSRWSPHDNFTREENEDNLYSFISEFNDKLASLKTAIGNITSKIDDIRNICNDNGLIYNDLITIKM